MNNKMTVLITGASSGIGKACAEQFAALGASLILCARREARLNALKRHLQDAYGVDVYTAVIDVCDRKQVNDALTVLPTNFKLIDVLVNNAGLAAGLEYLQEGTFDDWEMMIDTNIKGLLYFTRCVLPFMIERNEGHIINIGSIAGHQVYPKGVVYCATKHAVKAISMGLRQDLLGTNVRISSVDPGAVESEFSLVRFKGDAKRAAAVYEGMTPLTPNDVADAVVYCATRPKHVNVSEMILLPTDQASATMIARDRHE